MYTKGRQSSLTTVLAFSRLLGHFPKAMTHYSITALITLNCYYYYSESNIMFMLIHFVHNCQNSYSPQRNLHKNFDII